MELIGRTVARYRIVSKLGAGGMGVVYLAEDTELGRKVALKFLPHGGVIDPHALERFRVEARAASGLNHPCICTIYDVGEYDDAPYIVMEALEGDPLLVRTAGHPMKIDDLLDIGIQLADALDAAHAHGIIHRDVKPANIFLDARNRAKLLDFGLAKLTMGPAPAVTGIDTTSRALGHADLERLTEPGTAMGTVSYMSPEQARGEEVDARTDLFSLGAVLYEMATGARAFQGSTAAVIYDAILNRMPLPVARQNPLLPDRLDGVIAKALEKNRDLRYQHASELRADLRRVQRDLDLLSGTRRLDSVYLGGAAQERAAAGGPSGSSPALPPAPASSRTPWLAAAAATMVAAVLLVWVVLSGDRTSPETGATSLSASAQPAGATAPSGPLTAEEQVAGVTTDDPAGAVPADVDAPASAPSATTAPTPVPTAPRVATPPPTPRVTPPPRPAPPVDTGRGAGDTPVTPPARPDPVEPPAPTPAATAPPPIEREPPAAATPPAAGREVVEAPAPTPAAPPVESAPTPPPAPVTPSDDTLIRAVLRDYERAIETRDIALYRAVVPGLTAAEERTLVGSFRNVESQEVDIRVESLVIDGDTATARLERRVVAQTREGRSQTGTSSPTFRFERSARGWVIAAISVN